MSKMSTSLKPVLDKLPEVGRHRRLEATEAAVIAALHRKREHNRAKTVASRLEPVLKRGAGSSTDSILPLNIHKLIPSNNNHFIHR